MRAPLPTSLQGGSGRSAFFSTLETVVGPLELIAGPPAHLSVPSSRAAHPLSGPSRRSESVPGTSALWYNPHS